MLKTPELTGAVPSNVDPAMGTKTASSLGKSSSGSMPSGTNVTVWILSAVQLLERNKRPSEAEIRKGIEGNLCRCTGYQHIVDAVQYAAKKMRS